MRPCVLHISAGHLLMYVEYAYCLNMSFFHETKPQHFLVMKTALKEEVFLLDGNLSQCIQKLSFISKICLRLMFKHGENLFMVNMNTFLDFKSDESKH